MLDLTLRDLEYLVALAHSKSFVKAAEKCHVSQPALSKQLKHIESTLNVILFERSKRHVQLTEMGEILVPQAQKILDEAHLFQQLAAGSQAPLSGPFRLGAIASSCAYLLPYFIHPLKSQYPNLKLMIEEGLTHSLIEQLKQGQLDAVIAANTVIDETLSSAPLFFEPFWLATQSSSPPPMKSPVPVSQINPDALLLLADGHCLKDQTLGICALNESDTSLNVRATSLETLLQMTSVGLGISIIPSLAIPHHTQLAKTLSFHPLATAKKKQENGRQMLLFYRKSYPLPQNITSLTRCIQEHLPNTVQTILE
ncbi:MAG: LysR family transcriptional regulator [Cyanobacteria bacterium]|nr:LysR family transcriptional regulator [Cyanobacteriota bacterium]